MKSDNRNKKSDNHVTRPFIVACRLSEDEKQEFDKLMKNSDLSISETIRYAVKEALNNVL